MPKFEDLSGPHKLKTHFALGQTLHKAGEVVTLSHADAVSLVAGGHAVAVDEDGKEICPKCTRLRCCSAKCWRAHCPKDISDAAVERDFGKHVSAAEQAEREAVQDALKAIRESGDPEDLPPVLDPGAPDAPPTMPQDAPADPQAQEALPESPEEPAGDSTAPGAPKRSRRKLEE